jgi:hypothetical protein
MCKLGKYSPEYKDQAILVNKFIPCWMVPKLHIVVSEIITFYLKRVVLK